jgi:hypothetical protein
MSTNTDHNNMCREIRIILTYILHVRACIDMFWKDPIVLCTYFYLSRYQGVVTLYVFVYICMHLILEKYKRVCIVTINTCRDVHGAFYTCGISTVKHSNTYAIRECVVRIASKTRVLSNHENI